MYKIGDIVIYNYVEYIIIFVEDNVLHLIDNKNNGIAILTTLL